MRQLATLITLKIPRLHLTKRLSRERHLGPSREGLRYGAGPTGDLYWHVEGREGLQRQWILVCGQLNPTPRLRCLWWGSWTPSSPVNTHTESF